MAPDANMPARLVPDEPLPPYTFVPGRNPHPISDPAGHSFGIIADKPAKIEPDRWQESKPYLLGIDLFNAGYYWESHEQWESLWHACGRSGPEADFLKGLIKLAAAGVKHLEGNAVGVETHSCRAAILFRETRQVVQTGKKLYIGFQIDKLIELAETICRKGWPTGSVFLVPI